MNEPEIPLWARDLAIEAMECEGDMTARLAHLFVEVRRKTVEECAKLMLDRQTSRALGTMKFDSDHDAVLALRDEEPS